MRTRLSFITGALFVATTSIAQTECHTPDPMPPAMITGPVLSCANTLYTASTNNAAYIPNASTPIKTIRAVLHIMQKADGSENFQASSPADMAFLNAIFGPVGGPNPPTLNDCFGAIMAPEYAGPTGDPYTPDSRIRVRLD